MRRLYNNPAEAEGPRCATLGRLQQAPHAAARRRMMNAEFLPRAQSQADIGDQLDAAPAPAPRCSPPLNPCFDKNRLGWSGDPPPLASPGPELSSSQITSQLIEQLLKLRLASVAAAASEGGSSLGDTVQVRHVSGV